MMNVLHNNSRMGIHQNVHTKWPTWFLIIKGAFYSELCMEIIILNKAG